MTNDIKIREMVPGDTNFIISSWLFSYQASCAHGEKEPTNPELFYEKYRPTVEKCLRRKTTKCLVAAVPDARDVIIGYVVYEQADDKNIIHYVYVKRGFNNFGVAKQLMADLPFKSGVILASHKTHTGKMYLINKYGFIYAPDLV